MSDIKRLRNLTAVEQSVFVENRRIVLAPKEEKAFDSAVAAVFLAVCDGLVELVIDAPEIGASYSDDKNADFIWLANFTGNPDAPKTVKRKKKMSRGEFEWVDAPNPLAEPIDVVREFDLGQREYDTADGPMADNLGEKEIRIPKYGRRQLPKNEALWSLQRDANSGWISPYHKGRIKVSRPRSNFEPDTSWALDDMRCYLFMMDRNAQLGPSEAQVRVSQTEQDLDDAIREAKDLCMKRLHFRLADPQYRLITKSEYEEFRNEFEKAPSPSAPAKSSSISSARA